MSGLLASLVIIGGFLVFLALLLLGIRAAISIVYHAESGAWHA